jgi:hypothetical protein
MVEYLVATSAWKGDGGRAGYGQASGMRKKKKCLPEIRARAALAAFSSYSQA